GPRRAGGRATTCAWQDFRGVVIQASANRGLQLPPARRQPAAVICGYLCAVPVVVASHASDVGTSSAPGQRLRRRGNPATLWPRPVSGQGVVAHGERDHATAGTGARG